MVEFGASIRTIDDPNNPFVKVINFLRSCFFKLEKRSGGVDCLPVLPLRVEATLQRERMSPNGRIVVLQPIVLVVRPTTGPAAVNLHNEEEGLLLICCLSAIPGTNDQTPSTAHSFFFNTPLVHVCITYIWMYPMIHQNPFFKVAHGHRVVLAHYRAAQRCIYRR